MFFVGYFILIFKILFLFRGEGREKEGEKHPCVVASHAYPTGTRPAAQQCVLTGNQTGNPLLCRLALNPLSHSSQGGFLCFISFNTTSF